jgi:hypothetical protein
MLLPRVRMHQNMITRLHAKRAWCFTMRIAITHFPFGASASCGYFSSQASAYSGPPRKLYPPPLRLSTTKRLTDFVAAKGRCFSLGRLAPQHTLRSPPTYSPPSRSPLRLSVRSLTHLLHILSSAATTSHGDSRRVPPPRQWAFHQSIVSAAHQRRPGSHGLDYGA